MKFLTAIVLMWASYSSSTWASNVPCAQALALGWHTLSGDVHGALKPVVQNQQRVRLYDSQNKLLAEGSALRILLDYDAELLIVVGDPNDCAEVEQDDPFGSAPVPLMVPKGTQVYIDRIAAVEVLSLGISSAVSPLAARSPSASSVVKTPKQKIHIDTAISELVPRYGEVDFTRSGAGVEFLKLNYNGRLMDVMIRFDPVTEIVSDFLLSSEDDLRAFETLTKSWLH